MRYLQYINEKYYKRYEDTEILVNPSSQELLKYYNIRNGYTPPVELRWVSNWKLKRLYVWDAEYLHPDIMGFFKELSMNCIVRGTSTLRSDGKLHTEDLDDITTKPGIRKPAYNKALDYLQPYFDENIVQKIYASYDRDCEKYGERWLSQWWRD